MRVFLPFNSEYFLNYYSNMYLLEKIEREVIPEIIHRHILNNNVINIDIYSDKNFSGLESFSDKVHYIRNESYVGENFVDLVESYTKSLSLDQEVIVYHNPLFPFVSMDKASSAFAFVKCNPNCILNAEFGITSDPATHRHIDIGALSVFNFHTLKRLGARTTNCNERIELSALEMLCLRHLDDLEHYNLIINSGFKA